MSDEQPHHEWDAVTYDSLSLPHEQWGRDVVNGLQLRGDERVLDVGAGTGRDTETLLQRLPRGHVVAVDGTAAMLAKLRSRLAGAGTDRLTVLQLDLAQDWELAEPVDAAISVATLHWLADHERFFRNLFSAMRPGGVVRAEWGGAGNVAEVDAVLGELSLPRLREIANYASAEKTERRLRAAGFIDVRVEAVPGLVRMPPGAQWESLMRTVVLGPVLDRLPEQRREPLVAEVSNRLNECGVSYVRLHAMARRADS